MKFVYDAQNEFLIRPMWNLIKRQFRGLEQDSRDKSKTIKTRWIFDRRS